MHERPQAALFVALRELGYRVDATGNKLPAVIHGQVRGEKAEVRSCTVSINESSQFASALKLSAKHGRWDVKVAGDDDEEAPYVTMTERLVEVFPWNGGRFRIEPDASSGSYFWAAGWLFPAQTSNYSGPRTDNISIFDLRLRLKGAIKESKFFSVRVLHWPDSDWQVDQEFPAILPPPPAFPGTISRSRDLGDSIMTAITVAPFASTTSRFTELGRLRVQECERVKALEAELSRCGATARDYGSPLSTEDDDELTTEDGEVLTDDNLDTLEVHPANTGELHGAEIETYNDHRMAMCFAILGLKVPGIRLKNPACVKKTFPNFFQKLAAAPPNGLGVEIWEVRDGKRTRKLEGEDLFAD
jgi:3-phosphoshikimate 1-carboxyvinyltransferase